MKERRDRWTATIAISISESPDLSHLGMSDRHVKRAMEAVATYLLASGYRLAYGGDLRRDGFTEQLFELVSRYARSPQSDGQPGVIDYLPWSAPAFLSSKDVRDLSDRLGSAAQIKCLAHDGTVLEPTEFPAEPPRDQSETASSLTAMRRIMLRETAARVILGGRVEGYQGAMPGIAEEALLTLQAGKPLYIIGGFGGCARDIAESLNLVEPLHDPQRTSWDGYEDFESFGADMLHNGLSREENQAMAETPHIHEAVILLLRGLDRTVLAKRRH